MSNSRTTLIGWILTSVIIVGGIALLVFLGGSPASKNSTLPALRTNDHVRGLTTAPAIVTVYGDFQCPACLAYEPILQGLQQEFGEKFSLVFRHFPLKSTHKYADASARASEAADLQGKFWEMHDLLYDRQRSWTGSSDIDATLADYAKELGLDLAKFTTDYTSQAVKTRIDRDINDGLALGINSTPTFYLNNEKIANPASQEAFAELIRSKLPK